MTTHSPESDRAVNEVPAAAPATAHAAHPATPTVPIGYAPELFADPPAAPARFWELARRGQLRWGMCALLFFATTINYMDRQVLGILAPYLQQEIGWTESQYGLIVASFTIAYALGLLGFGKLIDRVGVRASYAGSLVAWSLAAMSHALAGTAMGLGGARFLLGLGEAGNFPCAIKSVAEWFPKKERALATGIFNSGCNIGAIAAPLFVPWIALTWGWRWAFVAVGATGFIWLFFWMRHYRSPEKHPSLTRQELRHIQSDPAESETPVKWRQLFKYRQTWAFALGKMLTDPVWWFYLYWLPKFLQKEHGVTLGKIGIPLVIIYLLADFGSIGGGWLSSRLIGRGRTVNFGRKVAMLVCALCVVPTMLASQVSSIELAIGLVALAAAAHQGWSANLFTLATDLFPKRAVASVIGIGGFLGAIGGMLFQMGTGYLLEWNGNDYAPIFVVCGSAYVAALFVIHRIVPRMQPVKL